MKTISHFHIKPFSLLLLSIPLIMAMQCEKDSREDSPKELPLITQTGEHTFGCLLDGEVWLPESHSRSLFGGPPKLTASVDKNNNYRTAVVAHKRRKNENSPHHTLAFAVNEPFLDDTTFLTPDLSENYGNYYFDLQLGGSLMKYRTSVSKNSWVHFSYFDTIQQIASGSFSMNLVNIDDEFDTVRVREGRFDVIFGY